MVTGLKQCPSCKAFQDAIETDCPNCGFNLTNVELVTKQKQRHVCLTVLLILMIVANSGAALLYLLGSQAISKWVPTAPGWVFAVLISLSLFNLVCAIALLRWKKWGFWGFCGSAIVALFINLYIGSSVVSSSGGLIGVVLLYVVLHIGKQNKGWPQLDI